MDSVATAAGATGILHNLFFTLADEGDVCLIPSPYFTGFDGDLQVTSRVKLSMKKVEKMATTFHSITLQDPRVGVSPFPVPCPSLTDIDAGIAPATLDAALWEAGCKGRVSVLLLTSPHNPTGLAYSAAALRGAVEWCRVKGIQCVVDEVVCLSLLGVYMRDRGREGGWRGGRARGTGGLEGGG